jgi:hypothetical protein
VLTKGRSILVYLAENVSSDDVSHALFWYMAPKVLVDGAVWSIARTVLAITPMQTKALQGEGF